MLILSEVRQSCVWTKCKKDWRTKGWKKNTQIPCRTALQLIWYCRREYAEKILGAEIPAARQGICPGRAAWSEIYRLWGAIPHLCRRTYGFYFPGLAEVRGAAGSAGERPSGQSHKPSERPRQGTPVRKGIWRTYLCGTGGEVPDGAETGWDGILLCAQKIEKRAEWKGWVLRNYWNRRNQGDRNAQDEIFRI